MMRSFPEEYVAEFCDPRTPHEDFSAVLWALRPGLVKLVQLPVRLNNN
jgi:hypothetical protein